MNRRNFLSLFSAGVAGVALEQAIPFGRVWSFPKEIVVPKFVGFDPAFGSDFTIEEVWERGFKIGDTLRIRLPQRFIVRDYIGDFSQPPKWKICTITDVTAAFPPDNSRTPS